MSNFEKIKEAIAEMDEYSFAEFVDGFSTGSCGRCPCYGFCDGISVPEYVSCKDVLVLWLRKESEEVSEE